MTPIDFTGLSRKSLTLTDRILKAHGPRLTGSAACKAAGEILADAARAFADAVHTEEFVVRPASFFSYIKLLPVAYLAGFLAIWLGGGLYLVPLAGLIAGIVLMLFQFAFYLHIGDAFFPPKVGLNVEAVVEPCGRAKRELIISGHHDSAPVARIFSGPFRSLYVVAIFLPYAFFLFELAVLCWLEAGGGGGAAARNVQATGHAPLWVVVTAAAGLPFAAGYFSMVALKRGSPGAGDNLIASTLALCLGEEIAGRREELLTSTRLRIVSFDAEEAGLRGASAYMRRHAPDLFRLPCFHLNFDSIYRLDCLKALTSDINGSLPLSASMVEDLGRTATENGITLGRFGMLFGAGATDAAESARQGMPSTTIIGMPTEIIRPEIVYHTPSDTVDNIEPAAVEACLKIAAAYLRLLESGKERSG